MYRTCLHAILSLIDSELSHPALVELAFQIVFSLCSDKITTTPVMRYLRTGQDFFYKHLCRLPFSIKNPGKLGNTQHRLHNILFFVY